MYSDKFDTLLALLLLRLKLCDGRGVGKFKGDSVKRRGGSLGEGGIKDLDATCSGTADEGGRSICDNVDDLSRCRRIAPESDSTPGVYDDPL